MNFRTSSRSADDLPGGTSVPPGRADAPAKGSAESRSSVPWSLIAWPAILAVLALRHPDVLTNAQLTWEDGRIFLAEGLSRPWHATWFSPFLGYFIVLPRIVASFFSPLTMLHAPLVFNLFSLAVMAFALALPVSAAFAHVAPWPYRAAWVAACVLMPWPTETFGNITNIHWYVFLALALFSMGNFTGSPRWMKIALPPLLFLGVFTTPNAVLILPVLLARLWSARRDRAFQFRLHIFAIVLVAAMIVAARALATPPPRQGSADLAGVAAFLVKGLGYKVVLQSLAGGVRANHLQGTILYVAAASGSLLLTIIAAHTARHRRRWPGTVHVLAGALYFVLSPMWMAAVFRPQYVRHFILEGNYWGADRYFVLPSCFFFLLVLLSLRVLVRPRWLTPLAGLSALLFAVAVAQNFRYARIPDFGWRRQLRAYYQSVLDRREPGRDDRFSIVTFPGDPWVMQAPLFSPTERERDEIRKLLSRI